MWAMYFAVSRSGYNCGLGYLTLENIIISCIQYQDMIKSLKEPN